MLTFIVLLAALGPVQPDRGAAEKDLPASAIRSFLAAEPSTPRFCVEVGGRDPEPQVLDRIGRSAKRLVVNSQCANDESVAAVIRIGELVWESPTFVSLMLEREPLLDDGRRESRAYEFAWRDGVWVPGRVYVTLSCR